MTKKKAEMPARRRPGESKHSLRRIEAVEKQAQALQYRKMGLNYGQIAAKLNMPSHQAAWAACDAAMKKMLREPADTVRKLELDRLDAMFIVPYGNALRGDMSAVAVVLHIMQRRAKLLGLDVPEKKELTGKDGTDLNMAPTVILIGGPGEDGEPAVLSDSPALTSPG